MLIDSEGIVKKPPIWESPYLKRGVGGVVALLAITTIAVGALALKLEFANIGETPGIIMIATGGGVLILDLYLSYRKWYPIIESMDAKGVIDSQLKKAEYVVFTLNVRGVSGYGSLMVAYVTNGANDSLKVVYHDYYDPNYGINFAKSSRRYQETGMDRHRMNIDLGESPTEISFYELQKRHAGTKLVVNPEHDTHTAIYDRA